MKRILVFLMVAMLTVLSSGIAFGEPAGKPTADMKVFDLFVVRPLSIGISLLTTALYCVTVPFTFPAGVSEDAARFLIEDPWKYVGARHLGEFYYYKDGQPVPLPPEK